MAGRPRETSDDEIVQATVRAIGRVGPLKLTLAHVADEVGIAPATLVQRFGSKRGLLLAVARHGAGDASAVFARARGRRGPLAALHAGLGALTGDIDGPATLAHHLAFLQLDLADDEMRVHARAHSRAVRAAMRGLLEEAIGAGQLRGVDPGELAEAVYTTYSGALLTWALDGRGSLSSWLEREVERVLAPHRP